MDFRLMVSLNIVYFLGFVKIESSFMQTRFYINSIKILFFFFPLLLKYTMSLGQLISSPSLKQKLDNFGFETIEEIKEANLIQLSRGIKAE